MTSTEGSHSSGEREQGGTPFPIVGVGASAGGLEALSALLSRLPNKTGMAYVLIQHLDPTHQSFLPSLLARATSLPIHEAEDGMAVEADMIYVLPAGSDLILSCGRFLLTKRKPLSGLHFPIDLFLQSLAREKGTGAIGVLLSGSGSDGTAGIEAIREAGGVTLVQDPATTRFSGMPISAIATGCVDRIASVDQLAQALSELSLHPYLREEVSQGLGEGEGTWPSVARESEAEAFLQILRLLDRQTGVDFTLYKPTTLYRRMQRRLALCAVADFSSYLLFLQHHKQELSTLSEELLITVTSFFRDPPCFDLLREQILPRLLESQQARTGIRIWVPGCSTGEEVYSLLICLRASMPDHALFPFPLQVFGTDLHPRVIETARAGIYSEAALTSVEPGLVSRFFEQVNGQYRVRKAIRDHCIFAQQNVCQDSPFSRMDLISCRNLLMYLKPATQARVLTAFHYALNPEGFLLLGSSETVGSADDLFAPLEKNGQLYVKTASTSRGSSLLWNTAHLRAGHEMGKGIESDPRASAPAHALAEDWLRQAETVLLARYAPASVVIDNSLQILHFRGLTSSYLSPTGGRASLHLLKMVRPELKLPLRTAIAQARKSGLSVKKGGIVLLPLAEQGEAFPVSVEVIPLTAKSVNPCFLILFEEERSQLLVLAPKSPQAEKHPRGERSAKGAGERHRAQLERELVSTQQELQSIIEEMETATEALQSANEEILSSNEELQSLNEELETSKEELESTNEELLIINQELTQRNADLSAARDFAEAIIATIREPLLILDARLRILHANQSYSRVFQMQPKAVEKQLIYEVGEGIWNSARLRTLLESILPQNQSFENFEMELPRPILGRKMVRLNARRLHITNPNLEPLILLAFEEIAD